MPTVLRIGSVRFYFYSNEHRPRHVHIEVGDKDHHAKVGLDDLKIYKCRGLNSRQASKIQRLVKQNQQLLILCWEEFFGEKQK